MKKEEIIQSIKIITLSLILSFGINFVSAQITPPAGAPGSYNVIGPLNAGPSSQSKSGDLKFFLVTPMLGFNTGDALFASLNLNFIPNFSHYVDDLSSNGIKTDGLATDSLQINPMAGGTGDRPVCFEPDGTLSICNSPGVCGTANGKYLDSKPTLTSPTTTSLCASGSTFLGTISGTGQGLTDDPWTWQCSSIGNIPTTCKASYSAKCGTVNGTTLASDTTPIPFASRCAQFRSNGLAQQGITVNPNGDRWWICTLDAPNGSQEGPSIDACIVHSSIGSNSVSPGVCGNNVNLVYGEAASWGSLGGGTGGAHWVGATGNSGACSSGSMYGNDGGVEKFSQNNGFYLLYKWGCTGQNGGSNTPCQSISYSN